MANGVNNRDYHIKVGIDTSRFASIKDSVQKQLDDMSKTLVVTPDFDTQKVETDIANLKERLLELRKTQVIQLSLNDSDVLNSINSLSSELSTAFSKSFTNTVGKDFFSSFNAALAKTNEDLGKFAANATQMDGAMKNVKEALSQNPKDNTLETGIENLGRALRTLAKGYQEFEKLTGEGGFESLSQKTNYISEAIVKLRDEAAKEKIAFKGKLEFDREDLEEIKKTVQGLSSRINEKVKLKVDEKNLQEEIETAIKNLKPSTPINIQVAADSIESIKDLKTALEEAATARQKLKNINVGTGKNKVKAPSSGAKTSEVPTVSLDQNSIDLINDFIQKQAEVLNQKSQEADKTDEILEKERQLTEEAERRAREIAEAAKAEALLVSDFEKSQKRLSTIKNRLTYKSPTSLVDSSSAINEIDKTLNTFTKDKLRDLLSVNDLQGAKEYVALMEQAEARISDEERSLNNIATLENRRLKLLKEAVALRKAISYNKDSQFDNVSNTNDLNKIIDRLQSNEIPNKLATGVESSINETADSLNNFEKTIDKITIDFTPFKLTTNELDAAAKESDKLASNSRKLVDLINDYSRELKKHPELYQQVLDLQKKINKGQLNSSEAKQAIANVRLEMDRLGITTDTIWKKLKDTFGVRVKSALAGQGVFLIESSFRRIYTNVVALDTAMTELRKVTNATEDDYIKFLDNAANRAKALGATLTEVVNASADFARLGYDINQASQLADASLIYLNVGDDVANIEQASKTIISTMQGFGIEANNVMSIIDKFNEVANNYAASAGDIGEITRRSAAAMKVAGSDLSETIALGVAANEVVQDADTVGTAIKTMSMRLRGSKSDLEAAGEDVDGMAESTSVLRQEILALSGVDIMLDENTFKTPYQMLMELGAVWDDLSDVGRANVGELLFGKRQANIGFAILENYERAQEILETAQNSTGSALRENEIYLDSIQGRLDKLTASTEAFSASALDTDAVKTVVTGLTTVLDILTLIVDKAGLLPTLFAGIATIWAKDQKVGRECALLCQIA